MRLYLHKTYFSPFFFALLLHVLNRVNGLFHLGYSDFITKARGAIWLLLNWNSQVNYKLIDDIKFE